MFINIAYIAYLIYIFSAFNISLLFFEFFIICYSFNFKYRFLPCYFWFLFLSTFLKFVEWRSYQKKYYSKFTIKLINILRFSLLIICIIGRLKARLNQDCVFIFRNQNCEERFLTEKVPLKIQKLVINISASSNKLTSDSDDPVLQSGLWGYHWYYGGNWNYSNYTVKKSIVDSLRSEKKFVKLIKNGELAIGEEFQDENFKIYYSKKINFIGKEIIFMRINEIFLEDKQNSEKKYCEKYAKFLYSIVMGEKYGISFLHAYYKYNKNFLNAVLSESIFFVKHDLFSKMLEKIEFTLGKNKLIEIVRLNMTNCSRLELSTTILKKCEIAVMRDKLTNGYSEEHMLIYNRMITEDLDMNSLELTYNKEIYSDKHVYLDYISNLLVSLELLGMNEKDANFFMSLFSSIAAEHIHLSKFNSLSFFSLSNILGFPVSPGDIISEYEIIYKDFPKERKAWRKIWKNKFLFSYLHEESLIRRSNILEAVILHKTGRQLNLR